MILIAPFFIPLDSFDVRCLTEGVSEKYSWQCVAILRRFSDHGQGGC